MICCLVNLPPCLRGLAKDAFKWDPHIVLIYKAQNRFVNRFGWMWNRFTPRDPRRNDNVVNLKSIYDNRRHSFILSFIHLFIHSLIHRDSFNTNRYVPIDSWNPGCNRFVNVRPSAQWFRPSTRLSIIHSIYISSPLPGQFLYLRFNCNH